jgi:hypothetical protein
VIGRDCRRLWPRHRMRLSLGFRPSRAAPERERLGIDPFGARGMFRPHRRSPFPIKPFQNTRPPALFDLVA